MAERSMARQGVETFRIATILLPVPWLQILQRQIQEVRFGKFELRDKYNNILSSSGTTSSPLPVIQMAMGSCLCTEHPLSFF